MDNIGSIKLVSLHFDSKQKRQGQHSYVDVNKLITLLIVMELILVIMCKIPDYTELYESIASYFYFRVETFAGENFCEKKFSSVGRSARSFN